MIIRETSRAWSYLRERGLKKTLLARDAPFLIQFGKYGLCGVVSVVVLIAVTNLSRILFPEHFAMDLPQGTRAFNNSVVQFIAFVPSNFTAYALNRWLVFTPGRHGVRTELTLFTIISLISFSLGLILPVWLVKSFNVPNGIADISFVVSSALVNFACRKFFVFEK
ncbi:MAG: GtrA family protein [Akkermansiaceae bacterium]